MEAAPNLTEAERAEAIEKCPPQQRPLFTAWLDGTRTLDGDLIEVGQ